MTLLLPAAFFAAMDHGVVPTAVAETADLFTTDTTRGQFLQMSRGLAVILLAVLVASFLCHSYHIFIPRRYICSRIFLHNPPGEGNSELAQHRLAPEALKERALEFETKEPEVNPWVCIAMLVVTIGIMAATAEWVGVIPQNIIFNLTLLVAG